MTKITAVILLGLLTIAIQSINVPLCTNGAVSLSFRDTQGVLDSSTRATICHDKKSLFVSWENVDEQIISTFTKCNDPLYKEDAVEIFISTLNTYLQTYWEIQVSPKGVLFFSDITNPSGNCSRFSGDPQACTKLSATGKILSKGWEAHLVIDLNIVFRNQGGNFFYANLFRLDYTSNRPTRYLALNPTETPTPCFHVPAKFEKFVLLGITQSHISTQ